MVGTSRHCTFVVKKQKPCLSAKTKLVTCDLWYQARSKAGMTGGGGSKLAMSNPPPLENTDSDIY